MVAPDGRIVNVNKNSYPDIFFGLKGGFNNFGIVTNFKMRTVPQTLVYGGHLFYSQPQFEAAIKAIVNLQAKNKDPRVLIIALFNITPKQFSLILFLFYDAPTAPKGTFDEFLAIPHVSTVKTQSYLSFVQELNVSLIQTPR